MRSDNALERAELAAERIDEWRSHLLKLSSNSIPDVAEKSFLGRELRGAATVAAMAELEALLREMLISIGTHVNAEGVPIARLVPSLRSLASNSKFESLLNGGDHDKAWEHRLDITALEDSTVIARLPIRTHRSPQPPLDGRTIQPRHITLVWKVLGLPNPVPAASVVASLKKLTQIRNDVAHRNIEIGQVFSEAGRTAADIAKYLDDLVLLVLHIGSEWSGFLATQSYLAPEFRKVL